jgi:competence protein ComEA
MLERYKVPIFALVFLAIASGIIALLTYRPAPVIITINPPPPSATPKPIRVYVTGAVSSDPKTVELAAGSRVEEAIAAAGGPSTEADLAQINLARILSDGEQIVVPAKVKPGEPTAQAITSGNSGNTGAAPSATPKGKPTESKASPENPVNVNTADLVELQRLPGVGPVLAQKIIDYRNQHGPFKKLNDLNNVSGVGPSKMQDWANLVIFN